jgi:hypothetical protein
MAGGARKRQTGADQTLVEALAGLGCPVMGQMRLAFEPLPRLDPAVVLLAALASEHVEPRIVKALPWLALEYADLDWDWAVKEAQRRQAQNRLGFVVTLAQELGARSEGNEGKLARLAKIEEALFEIRLDREETLGEARLAEPKKEWLRENRSREARLWNLVTAIEPRDVAG